MDGDDWPDWITNHAFGHLTYFDAEGQERYCDNDELVPEGPSRRSCPKCGGLPTAEGHDPCIPNLPGVANACCGHGLNGYLMFDDGRTIDFPHARIWNDRPRWAAWRRTIAAFRAGANITPAAKRSDARRRGAKR